jgi:hypothetical protein
MIDDPAPNSSLCVTLLLQPRLPTLAHKIKVCSLLCPLCTRRAHRAPQRAVHPARVGPSNSVAPRKRSMQRCKQRSRCWRRKSSGWKTVSPSASPTTSAAEVEPAPAPEPEREERLTQLISAFQKTVEGQWSSVRLEWKEERWVPRKRKCTAATAPQRLPPPLTPLTLSRRLLLPPKRKREIACGRCRSTTSHHLAPLRTQLPPLATS